jgi:hypothetical protein
MSIVPPRRFRPAWALAWVASLTGVSLAIGPNWGGKYDPSLAVLTATLIAVVWYTYFTYRALHRQDPTLLIAEVSGLVNPIRLDLRLELTNHCPRRLVARPYLEVWIDGQPLPLDAFYTAQEDLVLDPHHEFGRDFNFPLTPPAAVATVQHDWHVHVRLTVFWADDLQECGKAGPYCYYAELRTGPAIGVTLGATQLRTHFAGFPAPPHSPPNGWAVLRRSASAV